MMLLERRSPEFCVLTSERNRPVVLDQGAALDKLAPLSTTVLQCPAAFVLTLDGEGISLARFVNIEPREAAKLQAICGEVALQGSPRFVSIDETVTCADGYRAQWVGVAPFALSCGTAGAICVLDVTARTDIQAADFERFFAIAGVVCQSNRDSRPEPHDGTDNFMLRLLDQVRSAQSMFIDGRPTEEVFSFLVNALALATNSSRGYLGAVQMQNGQRTLHTLGITASSSELPEDLFARRTIRLLPAIQRSLRDGKTVSADCVVWHDPENSHSPGDRLNHLLVVPCEHHDNVIGVIAIAGTKNAYSAHVVEQLRPFLQSFASLIAASRARNLGRQASEALRLRDRSLASISSAVAIADLGRPNRPIIYCNRAFEVMTGYPADEVVGRDFRLFEGPETDSQTKAQIRSAFDDGQECEMTVRTYRRDGSWFWNHLRFSPVGETSGAVRHMVVIADDITETLQNQRQLTESEARKSAILQSSLDCVLTVDINGLVLDSNPAAERALGHRRGEIINDALKKLIIPLSAEGLQANEVRVGERREISAVRRDGVSFPADLVVTAMLERGQPIYTAHLRDLTTWKKALKQQRETVAFQRAILDGANYMIIATDLEGTVRTFNNAASRMLGFSPEEVLGRVNLSNFHDPVEMRKRSRRLAQRSGEPAPHGFDVCVAAALHGDLSECTYVRKDGTRFPVQLSISKLQNDAGEASGFLAIGYDITERRIAQKEQQKFVALVENSDDFIGMSTLDGRAFYVNEAGLNLAGLDNTDQVLKTRIPNFVTKNTWAVVRDVAMPALRKHGKWEGEGQLRNFKTGQPTDVLITLFVVRDGKTGEPLCLATVQRDITEQKRAERALLQEKDFSETLIRSSVDGILAFDRDYQITAWNPAMEQFAGLVRSDVVGRPVLEVFPFLMNDSRFMNVLNGVSGIMKDSPYVVPETGRRGYFEAYCSPLRDASANIIGGLAVVRDTTERRKAEESIRMSEKRYRTVVESIREVIFFLRTNRTWGFLNPAWTEITGFDVEQTVGREWTEFVHPDDREMANGQMELLIQDDLESVRYEMRIVTESGEIKWVEVFARATTDDNGRTTGISGTLADVSERRKSAEEMLRAKETAEAAAKLKSEFLANMSHEIRTPINAVIGMTSILLDSTLSAEQQDYVNVIRSGGESLLSIIDEILDFSKIESGRMELERAPFDLRDSIEQALDLVAARASEKNLELAYLMDATAPATIAGDVGRLRQILVNLLSNAVKFTDRGNILVTASSTVIEGLRHRIQFSVKDSGIGIPANKLAHIFESFSQVDASTTRRYGGTGLGLTISKHLCEMNGGEMWVESTPGVGSTFHFTIVAEALESDSSQEDARCQFNLGGRVVAVVVPDKANWRVLQHHLVSWGMKPELFAGVAELRDWVAAGNKYDLSIVDSDAAQLNADVCESLLSRAALVLLHSVGRRKRLANVTTPGRKRTIFHAKPIKPSLLYESLLGLFAAEPIRIESTDRPAAPSELLAERIPARILLAEDNVVNQKVASLLLAKLGYRADVASNGREAVEALRRQPYDVILMDMQMPEMDGLAATKAILQEFGPAGQPYIIAMTANAMRADRDRCLEEGMRDFLSKPVQIADLKGAFERYGASGTPAVAVAPQPATIAWSMPEYLQEMVQTGESEIVSELMQLFRDESRGKLDLMKVALGSDDRETARRLAHGLKGSAAQIGALRLAGHCAELEVRLTESAGALAGKEQGTMLGTIVSEFGEVEELLCSNGLVS